MAKKVRKHYQKPKINQIRLEVEEAVLSGCKTSEFDGSGKGNKGCNFAACKATYAS